MESILNGGLGSDAIKLMSFKYELSTPSDNEDGIQVHRAKVSDVSGVVYAYASFFMGATNPLPHVNGQPQGWQHITLGQETDDKFTPAVSFGIHGAGRASEGQSDLASWLFDGRLDYYGMYARPLTPYHFKLKLNLNQNQMTAWVSGRGDDDWFMLVEGVPLMNAVTAINSVRVKQHPGAQGVEDVVIQSEQWADGEIIRPHLLAKKNRVVQENKGFKFQAMCSVWRKPNRHVTVTRKPRTMG